METKPIGMIEEIYGKGYPSLLSVISDRPDENKDKIIAYLRKGRVVAVAAGLFRDVITGERIPGEATCQTDGTYDWRSDVAYYVEKYNMKLPDEFIEHVLSK